MNCNSCQQTGFHNIEQVDEATLKEFDETGNLGIILKWIKDNNLYDVSVCDCCGDGESWYGEPGYHYGSEDPIGKNGPYEYNGGRCECD